jgi:hypothetical protein
MNPNFQEYYAWELSEILMTSHTTIHIDVTILNYFILRFKYPDVRKVGSQIIPKFTTDKKN